VARTAAADAKAVRRAAALLARRPAWRPDLLDLFPRRESTLDSSTMVEDLPPPLLAHVEAFLAQRERSCSGIGAALRWVWTNHPRCLRVKELFETVDTFVLVVRQISMLRADARAAGAVEGAPSDGMVICHIYDLACGHGLLGVLLARRFADIEVICVDLVRRDGFDHYRDGFLRTNTDAGGWLESAAVGATAEAGGVAARGGGPIFFEGDMADVVIKPNSFVTCVHACNEANRTAVVMATAAGAGFMAMPVRARPGRSSTLRVSHNKSVLHSAFVWALSGDPKRRFPARAVLHPRGAVLAVQACVMLTTRTSHCALLWKVWVVALTFLCPACAACATTTPATP
jgi:hypothetical protein